MDDIRNPEKLRQVLLNISEDVIEQVSDDVLKQLQYDIKKYVYEYGGSNVVYHDGKRKPTYQFLEAFDWWNVSKDIRSFTKELFYDPKNMDYDQDTWLHGSKIQGWGDARPYLADILNNPNKGDGERTSSLKLTKNYLSKKRLPYWTLFIEEMFDKKNIQNMITNTFRNYGVIRV